MDSIQTEIPTLGAPRIDSPLTKIREGVHKYSFADDGDRVSIYDDPDYLAEFIRKNEEIPAFEMAGPRKKIYFDPSKVKCALVTCGGLCPGLNDIIRSIVLELFHGYGVKNIFGIRYGLQGFIPKYGHPVIDLTPDRVGSILDTGGSILASSRGPQDIDEIVDSLERMNIGILFLIGGDGTLKAASKITDTIIERKLKISLVGIPKTIDNDIYLVSRSFGFDTAVDVATQAITAAHNEAKGYPNGIGLIKLMGRHSGFIAATASLAQQDANFVLIPEVDFDLDGKKGFLTSLERRLGERHHAVIVVAEGAGQKFFEDKKNETDDSGNIRLKDIGVFMKNMICRHFEKKGTEISLKYIDPSYIIRSLSANANDSVFCGFLARGSVHAGMAGKTGMIISSWNNRYVHVPLKSSVGKRKRIHPSGVLWRAVQEATGQGTMKNN